jgi:hypothetical protein
MILQLSTLDLGLPLLNLIFAAWLSLPRIGLHTVAAATPAATHRRFGDPPKLKSSIANHPDREPAKGALSRSRVSWAYKLGCRSCVSRVPSGGGTIPSVK